MSGAGADLSPWRRACLAAEVFALDPSGAGVIVRARPGPARDAWLSRLRAALPRDAPMRRVPASIADDRLLGGLDIAATLAAGRPVAETGIIAEADGGVLVVAMAERLPAGVAARIAAAIDAGTITLARDGIAATSPARIGFVALDEGCDADEAPPPILIERSACFVDLDSIGAREVTDEPIEADYAAARARLPTVECDASSVEALVGVAAALGIASLRAPLFALRTARAIAALEGAEKIEERHIALAAALSLAPRATRLPADASEDGEPPPDPDPGSDAENQQTDAADSEPKQLEDVVLEAAAASIPSALLAQIKAGGVVRAKASAQGKAGDRQISTRRGRPFGIRPGSPREGRISLVATLRAAAPWQPIRRREMADTGGYVAKVIVRPDDLRIVLHRQPRGATTIFVVDASGSSAINRLAEIKGAIELLLADCYVRRDSVALIAFRGKGAEIVLPPTRSLARARRRLAGLPGGGGTPLASGLDAAAVLAGQIRRRGETPLVVLMTDGHANVARDGAGGRARALEDALDAGRRLGADRIASLAIDTSAPGRQRDAVATQRIAEAMRADHIKLPVADAAHVNAAVRKSAQRLQG
jgi:magnesium chelatase subunit D